MNKLFFRLFFIVLFWVLLWIYSFPWSSYSINVPYSWKDYKLWLDLQWWIELDYKVDLEEAKKEEDYNLEKQNSIIEWLKSIIDKRIEVLNINDSVISSASYWWEEHIVVQIPLKWNNILENDENIKRAKDAIWKVVKIEFKEKRTEVSIDDLEERQSIASEALDEALNSDFLFSSLSLKYKDNYENIETGSFSWSKDVFSNYFSLPDDIDVWVYGKVLTWTWKESIVFSEWAIKSVSWNSGLYVVDVKWINDSLNSSWSLERNYDVDYIFVSDKPSDWVVAKDSLWRSLSDKYFIKSSVQFDDLFQPLVELTFNDEWAKIFWELTKRLVWQQIAIFVWWELLTAPNVNTAILNWKAVITWSRDVEEAKKLSQDINIWVVPAPIYLTSEKTIDSRLWKNSLEQLLIAWFSGFVLILLFLIFVYRLSWFIASISLLLYVVIILSIVKTFWIVLTLASIAWLILSIGMAIDANILIFERVRDELRWWKSLHDAVKIWFSKSWSAIWDSNVTWLIVALILFIFGINLIKWFWLMLALWILVSLFSVLWISKVLIMLFSGICKKHKVFIWKV